MPGTTHTPLVGNRLELHVEATSDGIMVARQTDRTVVAHSRQWRDLRRKVDEAVARLYGNNVHVVLFIGAPTPPPDRRH